MEWWECAAGSTADYAVELSIELVFYTVKYVAHEVIFSSVPGQVAHGVGDPGAGNAGAGGVGGTGVGVGGT